MNRICSVETHPDPGSAESPISVGCELGKELEAEWIAKLLLRNGFGGIGGAFAGSAYPDNAAAAAAAALMAETLPAEAMIAATFGSEVARPERIGINPVASVLALRSRATGKGERKDKVNERDK
jgi:hypothetical protein